MHQNGSKQKGPEGPLGTTYEITQPPLKSLEIFRTLTKWSLQYKAREIMPESRLSVCFRSIRPDQAGVKVWKHKEAAHYSGLMVCGSVWNCPVCASKISELRRHELQKGNASWKAQGGEVYMLTLTVPHYALQRLKTILDGFSQARRLMMNRKPWKALKKRYQIAGTVRSLEMTWGENGWHVHSHELIFGRIAVNEAQFAAEVLVEWQKACLDAGLDAPNEHGTKVDDEFVSSDYLGKWGMDCELTKSNVKRGREGHYTPWDFLRMYDQGEGEKWADLFREYAKVFKGKRQLVWSDGMRDLLGLGKEATDLELAEEVHEEAVLLGTLSRADWRLVLASENRGELLAIAAIEGWPGVLSFIKKLIHQEGGLTPRPSLYGS